MYLMATKIRLGASVSTPWASLQISLRIFPATAAQARTVKLQLTELLVARRKTLLLQVWQVCHTRWDGVLRPLDKHDSHAIVRMHGHVAMEEPPTWIVRFEL
jgi:hypothetical protein